MEENQTQSMPVVQQQEVSFPQPKGLDKGNSNKKIIVAVVGVVLIVVFGGWLILRSSSGGSSTASPTPVGGLSSFPTPDVATPMPSPSPTPSPSPIAKDKVKIEVLNGTGIPGEATFLQKELSKLGFENIEIGNADTQDQKETIVTYSRELDAATADEITQKLEGIYEKVRTRKASVSGGFDVSIKTGPRKTSSPASTPTAKSSPTTKATPSPTPQQVEE